MDQGEAQKPLSDDLEAPLPLTWQSSFILNLEKQPLAKELLTLSMIIAFLGSR